MLGGDGIEQIIQRLDADVASMASRSLGEMGM
jgi:hypothetical protein